jgi:hypothetical protein
VKIYLAGPMSYLPEFNYPAFDKAAKKLRQAGHEVFNPADNDREKGYSQEIADAGGKVSPALKRRIILDDLTYICKHAEAIAYLPGWDGSTLPPCVEGARLASGPFLPGLQCKWRDGDYTCTWAGSAGAKIEHALAEWLGDLIRLDVPREWII